MTRAQEFESAWLHVSCHLATEKARGEDFADGLNCSEARRVAFRCGCYRIS